MITNFEEYTHELTDQEKTALPKVMNIMKSKNGKGLAITNSEISFHLKTVNGLDISEPRIRKILNVIRVNGLVTKIVASSKGYYRAVTEEEMSKYLKGLKERIEAQEALYKALLNQSQNNFINPQKPGKQMGFFDH